MSNLKESFEDVADWCESHLEEKRGREIGMTFGAMVRAYGQLATIPSRFHGEERAAKEQELNLKAEQLLRVVSSQILLAHDQDQNRCRILQPSSMRTNMIYDNGPRDQG